MNQHVCNIERRIHTLKMNVWKFYRGKMISPKRILEMLNFLAQKFLLYSDFLDDGFEKRIVGDEFKSRLNELYVIEALFNNNIKLEHKGNKGLDIWIENIKGWGEFVAATDDEVGKNRSLEGIIPPDENYHLLRLTSVINTKICKAKRDMEKGLVKDAEPIILFVSSCGLRDPFLLTPKGFISSYLRTVFPLGETVLYVNPVAETSEMRRDYKLGIPKKGISVSNDFFLREENAHISAIVFSFQTILQHYFSPEVKFESGDDFVIVHNPLAKNPIPIGLLRSHHEYKCAFNDGVLSIKECNDKKILAT